MPLVTTDAIRQCGDELDTTRFFVARIEQGMVDVDAATINKTAQIFGVSVRQILDASLLTKTKEFNSTSTNEKGVTENS